MSANGTGPEFSELTEAEVDRASQLNQLLADGYENVKPGLIRARLGNDEVAVVVAVSTEGGEETYEAVAVLVNEAMLPLLAVPFDPIGYTE